MKLPIQRVAIIGGGVGGLAAAIALRRIGIEAITYERAVVPRELGAGLSLWTNALAALRRLDLADPVIACGSKIQYSRVLTSDGRVLGSTNAGEHEREYGEPSVALHRADLQRVLLSFLPPESVRFGITCMGFAERGSHVDVTFADGSTDRVDLLLGADGIHSVIRRQLFPGLNLRYSGYAAWRGITSAPEPMQAGLTSESWGCGLRFGIVPIDRDRIYWFATVNTRAGLTPPPDENKRRLLHLFGNWHAPIRRLIERTPAESILYNDILDLAPFKPWSRGRVTLLGDAAHPTTPNMGQGACMAIESAVVLAMFLARSDDLAAALRQYEAARQPRTAWVTHSSWRFGRVAQVDNSLLCGTRNLLLRLTPSSVSKNQFDAAWRFVPPP